MVCDPNDNTLNPFVIPPPQFPGFGLPFCAPQIPFPDFTLPAGIPEDLLNLIKSLIARIPGGPFFGNITNFTKDVMDVIASLLNQIAPYLGLYRFLQALLNMIICIIEVFCSATNPFAMLRAIRRLFKTCLPDFLALFPWLALLAMIIALLLLLLALIDYLIAQILAIINDIIKDLIRLGEAIGFNNAEAQLAEARKIAQLLCLIEQLFAILVAFQAILAIIQALLQLAGKQVCAKSSDGCCPDDVCPPFIFNSPNGFSGISGEFVYQKELDNDATLLPPGIVLPPIRTERWQFFDSSSSPYKFADIITPIDEATFWPEGKSYQADTSLKKAPYTLDMTVTANPAAFNHPDPIGTERPFKIKNIIVTLRPTTSFTNYTGSTTPESTGVIRLEGGLVYEEDGTTPFNISGTQATVNTFFHSDPGIGVPASDDGYYFFNASWTLNISHPVLVGENIITLGCDPSFQTEASLLNATLLPLTIDLTLPDVGSTLNCLTDSMARIRANVSAENLAIEQAVMQACLNNLKDQTLAAYKSAIDQGSNQYNSTITLDTDIQFVSKPIRVSVVLNDTGNNTISANMPSSVQAEVAAKLVGLPTLGQMSAFVYDGYQAFDSQLTSKAAGDGSLTVTFNGNVLSTIINRDDPDATTSIIPNVKTYTFVGIPVSATEGGIPRRDETDVARDGD